MSIWFKTPTHEDAANLKPGTMMEWLDMHITEVGDDYLKGDMPVDHRTVQPYGILHGGASVALAETLGSVAAHMVVDSSKFYTVGMEINANHLRPVKSGRVVGTARPIHLGKSSQVWSIEIHNEENKLVCVSRITMAVVPKERLT